VFSDVQYLPSVLRVVGKGSPSSPGKKIYEGIAECRFSVRSNTKKFSWLVYGTSIRATRELQHSTNISAHSNIALSSYAEVSAHGEVYSGFFPFFSKLNLFTCFLEDGRFQFCKDYKGRFSLRIASFSWCCGSHWWQAHL